MPIDNIEMTGEVSLYIGDDLARLISNVVVSGGKNYIASVIAGETTYAGDYIAIGTDGTAESLGNTSLGAEVGTRVQGTVSRTDNVVTVDATFDAGNPATEQALQEAGLFTASADGTMVARTTFGVVTKPTDDSLRIVWRITVG